MKKFLTPKTKTIFLLSFIAVLILGSIYFIYLLAKLPTSLDKDLTKLGKAGEKVKEDYFQTDTLAITQNQTNYQIKDFMVSGPLIKVAGQDEKITNKEMDIEFPKDYKEPINIKLDEQRNITITDKNSKNYKNKTLVKESQTILDEITNKNQEDKYLKYESDRKSIYYAYQKNEQQRELKNWIIYNEKDNNQEEKEEYQINNAKIKLNDNGQIEVFYFTEQDLKNQETIQNVDSNLLERAQRTLMKESGEDILNNNKTPDFIIPKPYYINKNGDQIDLTWEVDQETNTITTKFNPEKEDYPVALDPTISFYAPINMAIDLDNDSSTMFGYSMASGDFDDDTDTDLAIRGNCDNSRGCVYIFYQKNNTLENYDIGADLAIVGENEYDSFGSSMESGDFNNDGKTDLAVGANNYSSSTGQVYIFYNDGIIPQKAQDADLIIRGEIANGYFSQTLASGDFNNDGKTDLVVGSLEYLSQTGRVYIFYNDGSMPVTAATADVIITGEATSNFFGQSMTRGDFNYDGRIDLAIGANGYSSSTGRVYIFYNDGTIPTSAGSADVIINGEGINYYFGQSVTSGDFNYDGRVDLAVGAYGYSTSTGRAYIFYNDGTIPTVASSADVIITGGAVSNQFGASVLGGDFNYDGRVDLIVGANQYNSYQGRAYIFYNDGTIPTTAGTADVTITGESSNSHFGYKISSGDFNNDNRLDLAIGAHAYSSSKGRAYVFYNDGSIPTSASSADRVMQNYSMTSGQFGASLISGDFNADGKVDLAVGAYGVNLVFIFYNDEDYPIIANAGADVVIRGEAGSNFSITLAQGDLNGDNKVDLIVGGYSYNTNTGRVYIFYNDGDYPLLATNADTIITGAVENSYFGKSIASGDFNYDGLNDLAVGAHGFNSNTGRVYIFYNNGTSIPNNSASADKIITGEATNDQFGCSIISGDFNYDGKTDLAVGSLKNNSNDGAIYIFYNDGSYSNSGSSSDVKIVGEAGSFFGDLMIAGDLNADGRTDLIVGSQSHLSSAGKVYIFYNDGSFPTSASSADVTIVGETVNNNFGVSLAIGDFNADGKADLAVGAIRYNSYQGRAYIFYNDGAMPISAGEADIIIGGEEKSISSGYLGVVCGGDFDADGRDDLAIGASQYNSGLGRVYILSSENSQIGMSFGYGNQYDNYFSNGPMLSGDFDADGKDDLVISVSSGGLRTYIFYGKDPIPRYASLSNEYIYGAGLGSGKGDLNNDGKTDLLLSDGTSVYIFYNKNGFFPNNCNLADYKITGESSSNFGQSIALGDFNFDGTIDLAVGANAYSSNTGRSYIFYNDGSIPVNAANADVIITGNASSDHFGYSMISGDFNYDTKTDLVISAYNSGSYGRAYIFYNDGTYPSGSASADLIITNTGSNGSGLGQSIASGDFNNDGRVDFALGAGLSGAGAIFIFYNDGSYPTSANSADVIIIGETNTFLGSAMTTGDFNYDGRVDIASGGWLYNTQTGRAYIFYCDGSIPTTGASADVKITGEATNSNFSQSMVGGDFNSDGRVDLAVGASIYSSNTGRAYIFNNDGSIPTAASSADSIITGSSTSDTYGISMAAGDFNADGRNDLVVGAPGSNGNYGMVYIFYNDQNKDITASTSRDNADFIISENSSANSNFGKAMITGDFNADGKPDLVVGAPGHNSSQGRILIFYNDGSIPSLASSADIIITGDTGSQFGSFFALTDLDIDEKSDLVVGGPNYSTNTGRTYVFYNDGSIPTVASSADLIITGVGSSNYFGQSIACGDFNYDGKSDLAVGAPNYSTNTGQVYIFYNDGSMPTSASSADVTITGEATNNYFGYSLAEGDLNYDGKDDLLVGAYGYGTNAGRVYVFYNDGSMSASAGSADRIIRGEASSSFGSSLAGGDFDGDGYDDLAAGAYSYGSNMGRVYIFSRRDFVFTNAFQADFNISSASSTTDKFGYFLSKADFNGDRVFDLMVGENDSGTGGYYVYYFNSRFNENDYIRSVGDERMTGTIRVK